MHMPPSASILNAERMSSGVLIEFGDGQSALYSTALLRDMLPSAAKVEETMPDEESEPAP
jgi:hypothetical protein